MANLGNDRNYISQCLQAAGDCLKAMLCGQAFEPNDLIAGALGLDRLTMLAPKTANAAQVARDLRVLARNCSALGSPAGQRLAGSLERGVRTIARTVADSGSSGPKGVHKQRDIGKRPQKAGKG